MKKWLMIGLVLVMAGITYAQIPQQEISRLITSLVDWRQQAVSPGVSFPTTCRTYWDTAGNFRYSCNGAPFATLGAGTVTGSGAANQVAVWTSASNISGYADFIWNDAIGFFNVGPNTISGTAGNYTIGSGNTEDASGSSSIFGNNNDLSGGSGSNTVVGFGNTETGSSNTVVGFNNISGGGSNFVAGFNNDTSGSFGSSQILGHDITDTGGSNQLIGNTISNDSNDVQALGEIIANPGAGNCDGCTIVGNNIDLTAFSGGGDVFLSSGGIAGTGAYVVVSPGASVRLGVSAIATPEVRITATHVAMGGATVTTLGSAIFTALGTPANGSMLYCSDCDPTATLLACTHVGVQTGAFAHRVNGAWKCIG